MRYAIAIFMLVAAGLLLFNYRGPTQEEQPHPAVVESAPQSGQQKTAADSNTEVSPQPAPLEEVDRAFEDKQATYDTLEKARRDLDRRLARMKMSLWQVRLPREQADAVTEQMMSAYKLITRPKLMGAFHDQEEMQQELTQVEYAKEKIRELRLQVEEWKKEGQEQ